MATGSGSVGSFPAGFGVPFPGVVGCARTGAIDSRGGASMSEELGSCAPFEAVAGVTLGRLGRDDVRVLRSPLMAEYGTLARMFGSIEGGIALFGGAGVPEGIRLLGGCGTCTIC